MHHYPFHPGDYLMATVHLDPMQDLAYRRLLDLYYSEEKPIPSDNPQVSRRVRLDESTVAEVLQEFFYETPEGWRHRRCDAEIALFNRRSEASKSNGMKGGRPKKQSGSNPSGNGNLVGFDKETCSGSGSGSSSSEEGGAGEGAPTTGETSELPTGFPVTVAQAIEMARQTGCAAPDEYLSEVWKQAHGRGGRDGAGTTIRRWGTHVDGRWDREQFDWKAKRNGNGSRTQTPRRRDSGDLNSDDRYA